LTAEHGFMPQDATGGAGPAGYNYSYFDQHVASRADLADEAAFRDSFRAGEAAESFSLFRLDDGTQVRLSDLWRTKPLVMEFGSFT
jgi:hypothetical protein